MDAFYEKRTAKRIKYKATVMIEIRDTGIFHYATMNNYGLGIKINKAIND